ncbi:hypothetical protein RFI_31355 [Reticulomyxa filosa]|uniref:RING-type domain-containing protein n=1 Tax=Reticulomyxa filosa TaxID=46433 RepID=X6LXF1_RETFI|nr:hypothetical protein RFI_31355 [Reticulomyxa filosa]|eukprot:ETO06041.1 hypothetical protein RFI_31355 [Reticulomyxa filosa]
MSYVSLDHFELSASRLALALPQKSKKSSKKRQVSNNPKKSGKKESKKGYNKIKKQKKRDELSYQKKDLSSKFCTVCLDNKSLDLMLLPCAHVFHDECISKSEKRNEIVCVFFFFLKMFVTFCFFFSRNCVFHWCVHKSKICREIKKINFFLWMHNNFSCPLCRQGIAQFVQLKCTKSTMKELEDLWHKYYTSNDSAMNDKKWIILETSDDAQLYNKSYLIKKD